MTLFPFCLIMVFEKIRSSKKLSNKTKNKIANISYILVTHNLQLNKPDVAGMLERKTKSVKGVNGRPKPPFKQVRTFASDLVSRLETGHR